MQSFKNFFQKSLMAAILMMGLCNAVRAQASGPYDVCSPQGQQQFSQATHNINMRSVTPQTAGPGQTVTVNGENFDTLPTLPAGGMMMIIGGTTYPGDLGSGDYRWVPVTVLSSTQLRVQLPAGFRLRNDGTLTPGEYNVTSMTPTYFSNVGNPATCNPAQGSFGGCCEEDIHLGLVWGYNRPSELPAPANFRATARSDSWVDMSWDNYESNQGIDGFHIYGKLCFGAPAFCPAPDINQIHNPDVWTKITGDQAGTAGQLPADATNYGLVANVLEDPPSFAGGTLYLAITAYRPDGEESEATMVTLNMNDDYGCYGRIQSPRPGGQVTITLRDVDGMDPVNRQDKATPFIFPGNNNQLTCTGNAQASFDGNLYPIADYYDDDQGFEPGVYPDSHLLPFTWDALAFSTPELTRMALKRSRGYSCYGGRDPQGQCIGGKYSNIAVDARCTTSAGQEVYVGLHLFNNHHDYSDYDPNLQDDTVYLVDFTAGPAYANQPDAHGMVAALPAGIANRAASVSGSLPTPMISNNRIVGSTPGSLTGSFRKHVYLIIPVASGSLPGTLVDDGSGTPDLGGFNTVLSWWESDVQLQFTNLPLHDDHCF